MDTEQQRLQYVRVTNNLPFPFVDMFDGIPVTIPCGKHQDLTPREAQHFFGYTPGAPKAQIVKHIAKRHGWNTSEFVKVDPATGKNKAEAWVDLLDIKAVMFKMVEAEEETAQLNAPVPADYEVREGGNDDLPPKNSGIGINHRKVGEKRQEPKRVEVQV